MLSRRDALQLIAVLSAGSTLSSTLSPTDAAAHLKASVSYDVTPAPSSSSLSIDVLVPGASEFADTMTHRMRDAMDWGMFGEGAPQEWVEVEKLLVEVEDDAPHSDALRDLSAAVVSLAIASWYAGARVGAELEGVRRAMLRPLRLCPHCWGSGRQAKANPAPCTMCAGAGTVATAAV